MKDEVEQVKSNSLALELLTDYKIHNKRLVGIIKTILIMWFLTIGYLVYVLNDIGVEQTTTETYDMIQEIDDIDTINGNIINKGK